MSTMLITGANKGLGREAARRLIAAGHDVWMAARDPDRGRAAAHEVGGRFVQLDVTDNASVSAAAQTVREAGTGLDVLINNAAIFTDSSVRETLLEELIQIYETNVFGVVRVIGSFLPLLEESDNPIIVNVASGLGSLTVTNNPERPEGSYTSLAYPSSKSAVVMLTSQYARALPDFRVNVIDPGWTATDMNGHSGPQSLTEGTDAIVALAQIGRDGPTNTFADRHGVVPW
jgi:NAD(P)-dependent dehydrogenase (short-subunit alcohol dehydrogenase family)